MFKKLSEYCNEHKLFSGLIFIILLAIVVLLFLSKGSLSRFFMPDVSLVEVEQGRSNLTGTGKELSKKEIIRVGGSNAVYPIFKLLAKEFERRESKYKVVLLPGGHSKGGVMGVANGEFEVGLISRDLKPEEEAQELTQIPFIRDGMAFVVHPNAQTKNLTSQQIRDIYSGKITNWRQLGGADAAIVVVDRPEHTSAKIRLRKTLFPPELKVTPSVIEMEKPGQVTESIGFIENSIGYTSFGDIAMQNLNLNVISIDNIYPSPGNLQKNLYPHHRTFSLVVGPNPDKKVMHLFDFMFGEHGQKLIEEKGYTSVIIKLVIATIPEQNILKQENRYRPLMKYLEKRLSMKYKIKLRHLPDYEDIVNEFMTGNVNAAFFGSMTYGIVQAKIGAVAIARPEKNGVSHYRGLILARADSGIRDWRDLKGKSFSMIKATTAADLFPRLYLKRHGVERPNDYLGSIQYVGSHDASVKMILNKTVAAGAAKDLIFERLAAENPQIKQELVVIAESKPVPDNALILRRELDIMCYHCHLGRLEKSAAASKPTKEGLCDYLTQQLRMALLDLDNTPEGRRILQHIGADRFVLTNDSDYENLYKMVQELGENLADYPLP